MTQLDTQPDVMLPSTCPVCGAYSFAPDVQQSTLLAVCDVLVIKALEQLGKYLRRGGQRNRWRGLGDRPLAAAHTLWTPDDHMVSKAIKGAWDVIPPLLETHGCCDITPIQVERLLDSYVHDLAITGTEHTVEELCFRLQSRLGLPVFLHRVDDDDS